MPARANAQGGGKSAQSMTQHLKHKLHRRYTVNFLEQYCKNIQPVNLMLQYYYYSFVYLRRHNYCLHFKQGHLSYSTWQTTSTSSSFRSLTEAISREAFPSHLIWKSIPIFYFLSLHHTTLFIILHHLYLSCLFTVSSPLEGKSPKGRDLVWLVHHYIPSTQHSTWHMDTSAP